MGLVAGYQPVPQQFFLNCRNRARDTRIFRRKKAYQGQQQQTRIQILAAVILHERIQLVAETEPADLFVYVISKTNPAFEGAILSELLNGSYCPVYSHPGHHLGVHEMPAWSPDLPDPVIRLRPEIFKRKN